MKDGDTGTISDKTLIERIDRLSATARTAWFGLLGYLAFAGVTLLGVEDADFFIDSLQTDLPLIGVSIPTPQFFVFGPILAAALYVYLHLYLLKLWDALAAPQPRPGGEPLSILVSPWLISDFGLRLRHDGAAQSRPMDWLAHAVTFLLVFLTGPLVIGMFWIRYWPAHDLGFSIVNAGLLALSLLTMGASLWSALRALRWRKGYRRGSSVLPMAVIALVICPPIAAVTLAKTDGPERIGLSPERLEAAAEAGHYDRWPGRLRDLRIARADLREVALVSLPDDWLPYQTHKRRFRVEFCDIEGLALEICGPPPYSSGDRPDRLAEARSEWCVGEFPTDAACRAYFDALDADFFTAWQDERRRLIAALDPWAPRNTDLRGALMSDAVFPGADLRGVDLSGADLTRAVFEGADLTGADLSDARLPDARMEGAVLDDAVLRNADLSDAWMEGVQLVGADLDQTILAGAWAKGADLSRAQVVGTGLVGTQLEGATLDFSSFIGTVDKPLVLSATNLRGATNVGGAMRHVDLSQASLDEDTDFSKSFADASVSLPSGQDRPNCWTSDALDEDEAFYGRWRWLAQTLPNDDGWSEVAPDGFRQVRPDFPVNDIIQRSCLRPSGR